MSLKGNLYGFLAYSNHIRKNTKKAEKLYRTAMEAGMEKEKYHMSYGMLLLKKGDFKEAQKLFSKIVINNPSKNATHMSAKVNLALTYWKLGEIDTAVEMLWEAHNKLKNSRTYGALGYFLIEQGDLEEALEFNLKALEYDEEDPVVLDNLAQVYFKMNDMKKAKDLFLKAEGYKPDQPDTLYYLGCIYQSEGDGETAVHKWQKALEGNISALSTISREDIEKKLNEIAG